MKIRLLLIILTMVFAVVLIGSQRGREALVIYPSTEGNTLVVTTTSGPRKIYSFSRERKTTVSVIKDIDYSTEALIDTWLSESNLPTDIKIDCEIDFPNAYSGSEEIAGSSISFHHSGEQKIAIVKISKEFWTYVDKQDATPVIESLKKSLRTGYGSEYLEDLSMTFAISIGDVKLD